MTARSNSRGMSGHQSAKPKSTSWATPPEIPAAINRLRPRRTDPCAMRTPPFFIAPVCFTRADNGLVQPWDPPFFMNPPYTNAVQGLFLARAAECGDGIALIFNRSETENFFRYVHGRASAKLEIAGRLHFYDRRGYRRGGNAGAPSVLIAWGPEDRDVLAELAAAAEYDGATVVWPEGKIPGQFVPLMLPRSILAVFVGTTRELIEQAFPEGEFDVAEVYRLADHPRFRGRRHARAKLRQTLYRSGGFDRVAHARYRRKA